MPYNAKTNWRNNDIVTPSDLNRIEQGIAESASPADDLILFVEPGGSDETGTGTSEKPFRTIQKAIDSFPTSNNFSKLCVIKMPEGDYPGFTLSAAKKIEISTQGTILITGDIVVNAGSITFVDESDTSVNLIGGRVLIGGGEFTSMVMLAVTTEGQVGQITAPGIECSANGHFGVHADTVVTNHDVAISCFHGYVNLKRLMTDKTPTGIMCECGIVQLGDDVIQATTKFVTKNGGRIYVGAQTNMPNY